MAKRVYAVKEIKRLMTRAADAAAPTAMGGTAPLGTKPHRHDGPEHTALLPIERISTAETDPTLVVAPDGTGGLEFRAETGGAPTTADYLTGTAQAGLSAEIVVGTTPGGELGGTWASPTVDATHSGSAHLALGATSSTAAPGDHGHRQWGAWSDAESYTPGDMVSLDGASWVCVLANTALMPMSPDYRTACVGTAPISYKRLGEADPSTMPAADEMGANDGTYVGSPTSVAGLLTGDSDTAVTLNGAGQYVSMSALGLAAGQARTILFWGVPVFTASGTTFFSDGAGASHGTFVTANSGGHQLLRFYDGTSDRDSLPIIDVSSGAKHMFVAAYNGTGWVFSLDGAPYGTPVAGNAPASVSPRIGSIDGGGMPDYNGPIDEPAIWDRAVTPAEIAGLNAVGTGTVVWERIQGATGATGATGSVSAATSLDLTDQGSDPSAPASGEHLLYTKSGGVYVQDPGGTVVGPLGSGGYAGPVWSVGTSMPGSPTTNDRVTRTDLGMDFYWDGTRWLSCTRYHLALGLGDFATPGGTPHSANGTYARSHFGDGGVHDHWIENVHFSTVVNTTNNGSNYWTFTVGGWTPSAASANTSANSAGGSFNNHTVAVNALAGIGTYELEGALTKTGSPGAIFVKAGVIYRIVGT